MRFARLGSNTLRYTKPRSDLVTWDFRHPEGHLDTDCSFPVQERYMIMGPEMLCYKHRVSDFSFGELIRN